MVCRTAILILSMIFSPAGIARSQTGTPSVAGFEVASIKPSVGAAPDIRPSGGTLTFIGMTLRDLIAIAYEVLDFQIVGASGWVNSDRFDIIAKAQGRPSIKQMMVPMLQNLLDDRFHLRVRRETRELPVLEMTIVKSGLKQVQVKGVAACSLIR